MFRPRNLLVFALALIAAGGVTYAWLLRGDLADLRRQLAESRDGAAELQKKLFAAQHAPAPAAPRPTAPVATAAVEAEGSQPPGPPGPENNFRERGPNRMEALRTEIMTDPKIAPLLLEQRKRALDQRYAALFRKLNLPAEQLDKLKTLLAEKEISRNDAQTLARSQGLGRDESRAMAQQADAESDAQIKALLGDTRYAQLATYEQTSSQRAAVGQIAERLSYTGAALNEAQSDQLVQLLASNPVNLPGGRNNLQEFGTLAANYGGRGPDLGGAMMGMAFGRGPSDEEISSYVEAKTARDAQILEQAASFLSTAQLAALRQSQQEENNQITLVTTMRAKFREAFPDRANRERGGRRNGGGGGG